jgi:hypothetical protein
MASRAASYYAREPVGALFDRVCRALGRMQIGLIRPGESEAYEIDGNGDEHPLSPEALCDRITHQPATSLHLWGAEPTDSLYCRIYTHGDVSVLELGMEGWSEPLRNRICDVLYDAFMASDSGIALVLDPDGLAAEDIFWDDLFIAHQERPALLDQCFPEMLVLDGTMARHIGPAPADGVVTFTVGRWVVHALALPAALERVRRTGGLACS